ncbi:hypothetical protein HYG86_03245 [Alkalicella caledoniensis]|uniref:Tail specific protease domain-containing protein n=1 Tax=Alkalicella caledoniensis TaxID=2731377 RepID=A0A7G9W587_ALKCA|nr:S41 family peptidase [Alkalicella caledoniensis]QNO13849.1 hypothetical protein HYG86_03245 [Alkalicella caledoniensis]
MFANRKVKIVSIISVILLVGVVIAFIYSNSYKGGTEGTRPVFEETLSFDTIISSEQMKEDLAQLKKDMVDVHPKTINGLPNEVEKAFQQAEVLIEHPMTVGEFTIVVSEIIIKLEDGHTSVANVFQGDLKLPMEIAYVDNEFYVLDGKDVMAGDKLISLGGITMQEIYEVAKRRVPAENIYWINDRVKDFALWESTLTQLGATIDDVKNIEVELKRYGEVIKTSLNFNDTYTRPVDNQRFYPVRYVSRGYSYFLDAENDLCYFLLTRCVYDDQYIAFMETMFKDVKDNGINNIVIDIRGNPGGDSRVINEFIRYIDIDEYLSFGGKGRTSTASKEQRGTGSRNSKAEPNLVNNIRAEEELIFDGKIYALIDNGTFSSANWFAVIIKDNELGTIIGEPTGNAPNSYGDILRFQLTNSKIRYFISHTQWVRPKGKGLGADEDALYPHYPIKYTLEDYINNTDLAMKKAIEVIKAEDR